MQQLNDEQWDILERENTDLAIAWDKIKIQIEKATPATRYKYLKAMEPEFTHYTLVLIQENNSRVVQAVQDLYDKFRYVEDVMLQEVVFPAQKTRGL